MATKQRTEREPGEPGEPRVGVIPPPPWGREEAPRRTRADKPALGREAIVDAAMHVVDTEGFDAVSMRRVAQEFGTGAASLYAYVANKDELLDLLVDRVMGECPPPADAPDPDPGVWLEQLKEMVRGSYRVIVSHRDVAKAFLGRIPFGPKGLVNVEGMLRLTRAHGLPDYIAAFLGDLIGQYMVGAAIEEHMWRERYPDATEEEVATAMGEIGDYLAALPKDRFPNLTEMAGLMVGKLGEPEPGAAGIQRSSDRFELGLDILMRGVATFLPAAAD